MDLNEAKFRVDQARTELYVICSDINKFTMSIPIRDTDSDCVLDGGLDAANWLIQQLESPPNREALAAYAHDAWSGWVTYMFEKMAPLIIPIDTRTFIEHPTAVEAFARWHRQMTTPYEDLPEYEKESDRREADKMIAIFRGDVATPTCRSGSDQPT